jgi:hypothetical protein
MLNPSSADAAVEDSTIRRCIGFATRESADGIIVVNLYAFRTADPRQLNPCPDPDGPENIRHLNQVAVISRVTNSPVVCAWVVWRGDRGAFVAGHMLRQGAHLVCLGMTTGGHPKHPLYVRADQPLVQYPA